MQIERVPITALMIDEKNLRHHGEENMTALRASLRRFGQQRPIIAGRDGVIIAGNGTYAAARDLGWPDQPVGWETIQQKATQDAVDVGSSCVNAEDKIASAQRGAFAALAW